MQNTPFDLRTFPVHLGLGASAVILERFTGDMAWYERYGARFDPVDGAEGRLVSLHTFSTSWPTWEMHPEGHELVVCTDGEMVVHQELPSGVATVTLRPGLAIINPPGVWHTADVAKTATALFITAGLGTEQRPR